MPQLSFANTNFCTPTDVTGFYRDAGLLLFDGADNLTTQISQCISIAKEIYLRQPLLAECEKRFLTKIDSWRTFKRSQINEKLSVIEREKALSDRAGRYPINGYIGSDGQFFDITDVQNFTKPGTYYYSSAPVNGTSGTYARTANPGDILFDTSTDLGYINRGTLASPTWQRFIAEDGIDFILNPSELKYTNVFAAGVIMAGRGFLSDKPNYQSQAIKAFFLNAKDSNLNDYKDSLKMALPRIQFNISGSGTATAYELGVSDGEIVLF